mgnify:CR=1 FL=1
MNSFKFWTIFIVFILFSSCIEPDPDENFVQTPVNIKKSTTTTNSSNNSATTTTTATSATTTTIVNNDSTTSTLTEITTTTTATSGTTTTIPSGSNLVINGSFEDAINNWTKLSSSGVLQISTSEFNEGPKSAYYETLTTSGDGREFGSNIFSIDKAKNIKIKGLFKTTSPVINTKVAFKIYYYKDEVSSAVTTAQSYYTQTATSLTSQNLWEEKTLERLSVNIPTDTTHIRISIRVNYVSGTGSASDRVYFDNIFVSNE